MEGIGRGCGSAGAGVGDPAADPELVVDSVLDAALGCAGDVTAAGEGELCVFEEEVVCPRPGSTMIPVASKAKHHFGPLIVFSPLLINISLRSNDGGRRLAADSMRCFFGTPTENTNSPDSKSEWTAKFQSIESKICGWRTYAPSCTMRQEV